MEKNPKSIIAADVSWVKNAQLFAEPGSCERLDRLPVNFCMQCNTVCSNQHIIVPWRYEIRASAHFHFSQEQIFRPGT